MMVLIMLFILQVFAVGVQGSAAAQAADNQIHVQLKLGQDTVEVNGKSIAVEKPYTVKGTTFVPLRIITTAFGAKVQWVASKQGILLTRGNQIIELHIGSKSALVNSKKQNLSVAPQMKNGTTMVPLRFISESFGAEVQFDSKTSMVTIAGALLTQDEQAAASQPSIIQDQGKSKIGDSYFGWSMDYYPTLTKTNQSFRGNFIQFADVKGEFGINIYVYQQTKNTPEDLLQSLIDAASGTILEQKTVKNGDAIAYAETIDKDQNNTYTISRAFLKGTTTYYVDFVIKKETDYKDPTKYSDYQKLLDSFQPSYNNTDQKLKDIAIVQNGLITYQNDSYGMNIKFPANWEKSTDSGSLYFYSQNDSADLNVIMTSIDKGESLQQWSQWEEDTFKQTFAESYRQVGPLQTTTIAGAPAEYRLMDYTFDGNNWTEIYDAYVFKGDYKLNFSYSYKKADSAKMKSMIEPMLQSITIDADKLNRTFGFISDTNKINWTAKKTVDNKDYGYSIEIPKLWNPSSNNDSSSLSYNFIGGSFSIVSSKTLSYNDAISRVNYFLDNNKKLNSSFTVYATHTFTKAGVAGMQFGYGGLNDSGFKYKTTTYVLTKNGITYLIDLIVDDAVSTQETNQRLSDAFDSLSFQ